MSRFLVFVAGLFVTGCAASPPPAAVTIAALPAPQPTCVPALEPVMRPPELPASYRKMTVGAVLPQADGAAVALVDPTQATIVPIYVAGTEAISIRERLAHSRYARPLTHDLFDATLHQLGVRVVRAQVDKLENGTFFGTLVLQGKSRYYELDARPSDAIALALGSDAPIYCAADVVTSAGMPRDQFESLAGRVAPP